MGMILLQSLLAQSSTTVANSGAERNNFALVLMSLGVVALGAVALGAPRLAKRINANKASKATADPRTPTASKPRS